MTNASRSTNKPLDCGSLSPDTRTSSVWTPGLSPPNCCDACQCVAPEYWLILVLDSPSMVASAIPRFAACVNTYVIARPVKVMRNAAPGASEYVSDVAN